MRRKVLVSVPPILIFVYRRRKKSNGAAARRAAAKAERDAIQAAAAAAPKPRVVPCMACLRATLGGPNVKSETGYCWDAPGRGRRYERCSSGGSCLPLPKASLPMVFHWLDYIRGNDVDPKEKEKRRIAVKVVLRGCGDGSFPAGGDPRLA
ncbi:hypothetical protein G7046_g10183 [Stylonectria norvegica]|nr:hypothetical protein G7046_g10183 [Stylonectria norvegica]